MDRSNVILQGVVGSTAYGLAHADSDIDQIGIYVAPLKTLMGLDGAKVFDDTKVTHEPDLTLHEVGKFCRLALACNPTITELLWLNDYTVSEASGRDLINIRKSFLSSDKVKARYGGYARSQAERLLRRNEEGKEGFSSDVKQRTAKHGRHCMRLVLQADELLQSGELTVNVSTHRDFLFEMGELAANDPESFYERAMDDIQDMYAIESVLPAEADWDTVNEVLIELREFEQ